MATIAEELAKGQRKISVAEFFEKNRHLLGFANPSQALLTSVREAVDNSLDACEEAKILPEIFVKVQEIDKNKYRVKVTDNGPGIVKKQVGPIFGTLLYGSKFMSVGGKQSRGQQGIGISAVVLYSQLTTGRPTTVISKIGKSEPAHRFVMHINTTTNEPELLSSDVVDWENNQGTSVEVELVAKYAESKQSVTEFIKQTAVVNPHAHFVYIDPKGKKWDFPRIAMSLPKSSKKLKPHPYGIEFGTLKTLLSHTKSRSLKSFLTTEFDKVGSGTADEILKAAELDAQIMPRLLTLDQMERLLNAMQTVKIMNPSLDGLSPIGAELLKKSLRAEYNLEFSQAISRGPAVYRGMPFQIEVAIGYGGEIKAEGTATLNRFANKVPLLYQQGACAITKAVQALNWKPYGLQQSGNSLPQGPVIILVHMASVWVPFTSESKEAVASYDEIIKETKLALQECGRHLQRYLGRKQRSTMEQKKRDMFKNYSAELAENLADITGGKKEDILAKLLKIAESMYVAGAPLGNAPEETKEVKSNG